MAFEGPLYIKLAGVKANADLRTKQYYFVKMLGSTAAAAYVTDGNATDVTAGDTITITYGTTTATYTFVASVTVNYDVLVAGTADGSLLNLARAINASGGTAGTDYKVPEANRLVTASSSVTSNHITLTAKTAGMAGNLIAVTTTATTFTISSDSAGAVPVTTLAGGADNDSVDVCAAVDGIPVGVLQNTPNIGQAADVLAVGETKVSADGTLSAGGLIGPSADGQADSKTVSSDSGEYVVGMVTVGAGANELVTAVVNCAAPHRAA